MHTRVLTALLGISTGIIVAEFSVSGSEVAVASLILGLAQCALYVLAKARTQKQGVLNNMHNLNIPLLSGIFCLALFLGVMRMQFSEVKNSFVCPQVCTFAGTVITSPETKDVYQIFAVRLDESSQVYDVQVKAPLYPKYRVGDSLTLSGKVTEPSTGMDHDGKQAFNYSRYLQLHSIGSEMFYPKIEQTTSVSDQPKSIITSLKQLQEFFLATIFLYVREPATSLASGMLFGDSSMSKELVETFRTVGLSHIIVLSGFNIAVLITFVLLLLFVLPLILRVLVAAVFVVLFVLMVGAEVSIVRATGMSFIALAALLVGRAYTARHALLLSLIAITLYEPRHLLYDVSLHLSFLATAGIVYLSDGLRLLFIKIKSKVYQEVCTTTLAAYLATLPYILYTFGTVSVYALLANLIVLPLVPMVMLFTFITVVTAPLFDGFGAVFGFITSLLGDFIIFVARSIEGLPFASVEFSITPLVMIGMYGCLTGLYFILTLRKKYIHNETRETKNDEILSGVLSY